MAKQKVARTRAASSLARIEYSRERGKAVARVVDRASKWLLAIIKGSDQYTRTVAVAFVEAYEGEKRRVHARLNSLETEIRHLNWRCEHVALQAAEEAAARLRDRGAA